MRVISDDDSDSEAGGDDHTKQDISDTNQCSAVSSGSPKRD